MTSVSQNGKYLFEPESQAIRVFQETEDEIPLWSFSSRLAYPNPPTPFGYLEALEAGYLVEYDIGELAFWTVVAAVAKRSELAAIWPNSSRR